MPRRNRNTATGRLKRRGRKLVEILWGVERFGVFGYGRVGQPRGAGAAAGAVRQDAPPAPALGGPDGSGCVEGRSVHAD
jgi:hypothetical protein